MIYQVIPEAISEIEPADQQGSALFLGSKAGASNLKLLRQRGIKAVLSVVDQQPQKYSSEDVIQHLVIRAEDRVEQDLMGWFEECFQFIKENRKRGGVLVHCMAGISRSSTIVIAYLIRQYGLTFGRAFDLVKARRSCVYPNMGFTRQLKEYEARAKELRKLGDSS